MLENSISQNKVIRNIVTGGTMVGTLLLPVKDAFAENFLAALLKDNKTVITNDENIKCTKNDGKLDCTVADSETWEDKTVSIPVSSCSAVQELEKIKKAFGDQFSQIKMTKECDTMGNKPNKPQDKGENKPDGNKSNEKPPENSKEAKLNNISANCSNTELAATITEAILEVKSADNIILDFGKEIIKKAKNPEDDIIKFPELIIKINNVIFSIDCDWIQDKILYTKYCREYGNLKIGVRRQFFKKTVSELIKLLIDINKEKPEIKKSATRITVTAGKGKYAEELKQAIEKYKCDKHNIEIHLGDEEVETKTGQNGKEFKLIRFRKMQIWVDGKMQSPLSVQNRGGFENSLIYEVMSDLKYLCEEKDYSKKWNYE